jgi:hypothetical protein
MGISFGRISNCDPIENDGYDGSSMAEFEI